VLYPPHRDAYQSNPSRNFGWGWLFLNAHPFKVERKLGEARQKLFNACERRLKRARDEKDSKRLERLDANGVAPRRWIGVAKT
jgi:hypothetical protein